MIKYIGSKRTLIDRIVRLIGAFGRESVVLDLFSGTARVGHGLKSAGIQVISNDHNAYAHMLARCYVQADRTAHARNAARLIDELNELPASPGYFTETFCVRSRFFHPKNGARIDAIREHIARLDLEPALEAVLLVSLMEAADRVDSTTGVQMAYLKRWASRAHNELHLRAPNLLDSAPGRPCEAHQLEAIDAARTLPADVAYLDPPYNQHSYLSNYHIWESLVRWDKPEVYGVACKRLDCRERKSVFNSKKQAPEAMRNLFRSVRAEVLVVSFSNEGYFSREWMETALGERGDVRVHEHDFKRYVGAQIGIYNLQGNKVGKVSHLRNTEFVFVAGPADRLDALDALRDEPSAQPLLFH